MKWVEISAGEWVNINLLAEVILPAGSRIILFIMADGEVLARRGCETRTEAETRLREIMAEVQS